jgi:hypothetical protein
MPPTVPIDQVQNALLEALGGIRRKARALSVLFGVGLVLAATVGLLLAVVLVDYLLNLPTWPRLLFVVLAAGGIVYAVWTYVARPLLAKLSLGDVAGRLEHAFPQFDDRLRSTVDFVRSDVPGSVVMKERVIAEANRLAGNVNLNSALAARPVMYAMAAGVGAVLLAVLLALGNRDLAKIALSRLLILDGQNWPKRVQIEVVKGVPAKVAAGQRVELRMRLAKGDREGTKAIVYYKYDNGRVQEQLMTRGTDGMYSVMIDAKGSSMNIWMKAGDDQTPPQVVDVVKRLAIQNVTAKITPPAYAKLESVAVNLSESPAYATVGSQVELAVMFNKPLAEDKPITLERVKEDMKLPPIVWKRTGSATAAGTWVAQESLRFRVHASDADSFENLGLEEYAVIVRPDQNPSVIIENPTRNEDRTAVAMVRLEAMAEDDFDISGMALVVDRKSDNKHWEIPLAGWSKVESQGDRKRFRVRYEWELSQLAEAQLKPGDVLEYAVRVTDNYNLNGALHEPVFSGKLRINIISQETLSLQVTNAIQAAAEKVRQVQNSQNRTKQETANLRNETKDKKQFDAADLMAIARLTDQQSTIAAQTRQLAGQMSAIERRLEENRSDNAELKDITRDVKRTLGETAEGQMSDASRKLAEAQQQGDPKNTSGDPQKRSEDRSKAMEGGEQKQREASEQLGKALEKMGNLGTFEQFVQQVRDLLNQQREISQQTRDVGRQTLGKRPEELTAEQRKKLEELADKQQKAAEKTEKLTGEMNKAAEQTQKSDPAASQAMKQASEQSQQQQVSPNQKQAAQSTKQNQQSQAQAKQKQAELGLQVMLDTLREAERRKLEQLNKELAKLQELIDNLIRRQAGHNIDNLRIQDVPEQLKLITDELLTKAQRVKDKMPAKPEIRQLDNSQALTERNTRDVSKTAEDVPKTGAEIAAILTKSAGFMERAVVSIKDVQLPAAYDPQQIKALASLDEAKGKTDEAAAEVQKQMEDADKEAIRQAYEKIKAEQEQINGETVKIDASPRLDDGTLKREEAVKLGRLPGQQGGLADRTQKLEEDLRQLGGVVYVWANKDIVDSMNDVKSDLGKSETGQATQAEEIRIVEQLDAMIKSLAVKLVEKEFHEQQQGGGGGGQAAKPKLPTEAEIRLLKELQRAINKSTKTIDALPNPDQEKLVALGGRQGELRGLLDEMLQKASKGEIKLDKEPDPKDRLPEEAGATDIDKQELDDWLRGGKSSDDQLAQDMKTVGQRMARSKQRLALDHDPGKTTQLIQERILKNLDHLIELSRQQQAQMKPGKGKGGQAQKPQVAVKPQEGGESKPNQGKQPAGSEKLSPGQKPNPDTSKDIREQASEWGHLTPRERDAIIEGTNDTIIPKYKRLTEDYYEAMGKKGSEQR